MRPVVIAVAITGSVPRKKDNPALPVLPSEQIESSHAAFEAGATLVHIHVRNDDESSSSDPDRFAGAGGRAQALPGHDRAILDRRPWPRSRGAGALAWSIGPRLASLSTGSVNFRPSSTRTMRRWSSIWRRG